MLLSSEYVLGFDFSPFPFLSCCSGLRLTHLAVEFAHWGHLIIAQVRGHTVDVVLIHIVAGSQSLAVCCRLHTFVALVFTHYGTGVHSQL